MPVSKTSSVPQLRVVADSDADAFKEAMELAGKFLSRRVRSEQEVRTKLTGAGTGSEVVERTLERLRELSLVDDHEFSRQWIEDRVRRRGLGRRALIGELQGKGISREVAEDVLAETDFDEAAQAVELAASFARKVAHHPLDQQAARILTMLARRGIEYDAARAAVAAVLPPEGWD